MITPPSWLLPYLEREWQDCWIFYKQGPDFTEEQYSELNGLSRGYLRSPHKNFRQEWVGVQIKLYKEWDKVTVPAY